MIIERFDLSVRDERALIYEGDTYFGFFTRAALTDQVGVRDAESFDASALAGGGPYPSAPPHPDAPLRMIDTIDGFDPTGGPQGLGFIRGSKLRFCMTDSQLV